MIIDSYDSKSKPLIQPQDMYEQGTKNENVTIITYSRFLLNYILENYDVTLYKTFRSIGEDLSIYLLKVDGREYFIYKTQIGATVASVLMQEVSVITGSHKFISFGSSGILDEEKCRGKIIVPSSSYRDEGVSYHYAPAEDYIEIKNYKFVDEFLNKNNIPHVVGKIWTTDGFYMETTNKIKARKDDGCIAVDMEISGLQAVANYCKFDYYTMIFPADSLEGSEWVREGLSDNVDNQLQIKSFEIVLQLAKSLY